MKKDLDEKIRLNKYIAASGICSRREADTIILKGRITVNGEIIKELGVKVNSVDEVCIDGKKIQPEKFVYIVLNKPKGFVTTLSDPHAERTVMELIKNACKERVVPVGRLDKNTTGVLLFTNDGTLTEKLTHPSYNKLKVYHAFLDKDLSKKDFDSILSGIELEDGPIKADGLDFVNPLEKNDVGIEIHSGRNRIVRRIFEHFGYKVVKLDRVYFAGLTKKGLTRGHWRFLTDNEVSMLKMGSYK